MSTDSDHPLAVADKVVLSFPDELSDWGRDQITTTRYRNYLRRTLDAPAPGLEFEEFADVGCCGNTLDILFRVETVEGGGRIGEETTIEFVERTGSVEGGWQVQSAAGPD